MFAFQDAKPDGDAMVRSLLGHGDPVSVCMDLCASVNMAKSPIAEKS